MSLLHDGGHSGPIIYANPFLYLIVNPLMRQLVALRMAKDHMIVTMEIY